VRLAEDMETASQYGADPAGGITRAAWTPELSDALDWLRDRFEQAGLEVASDRAGNLFGRCDVGSGRAVLLGSHFDTVPRGGPFDGAFGVLGGLAGIELLRGGMLSRNGPFG
jgi:allantoate deiminase